MSEDLLARWATYQLGAALLGRRGAFPIVGATLEQGVCLAVAAYFRERRQTLDLDRIALWAELYYELDVAEVLFEAVRYYREVRTTVLALLPLEIAKRAHDVEVSEAERIVELLERRKALIALQYSLLPQEAA
ncbi:MAG: hypothetical protein U0174_23125 [Polyangiaceae bacterium]